ncbi:hypothetical protein NDU88_005480 [Pleurodeles waltl]|uniref:Uncharacterized protein n=1 Tax=Pleurodeles waltl TaxID=8319 RepID=A0AAV7L1D5_PLEWA|nr:hypothetical protein NDU88_005480 [Pleurodeles waltl]
MSPPSYTSAAAPGWTRGCRQTPGDGCTFTTTPAVLGTGEQGPAAGRPLPVQEGAHHGARWRRPGHPGPRPRGVSVAVSQGRLVLEKVGTARGAAAADPLGVAAAKSQLCQAMLYLTEPPLSGCRRHCLLSPFSR